MIGNDKVRFCNQCSLNVYNISTMTKQQGEALILKTEGRLCVKLYRRADGTILTADCPVGLRAIRKRISRIASATLTAALSLFTNDACLRKLGGEFQAIRQSPSKELKRRTIAQLLQEQFLMPYVV
jgi:hypothetical protein